MPSKYKLLLIISVTYCVFLTNCSSSPSAPSFDVIQKTKSPQESAAQFVDPLIPDPCKNLKMIGELSEIDFRKLFLCLNQKGGLDPLRPILLDNPDNTKSFVTLYNDLFGANSDRRLQTLEFIESFKRSGGLKDLLTLLSLSIETFIDNPDFDRSLKSILKSTLTDDAHLLALLKEMVEYPEANQLSLILSNSIDRGIFEHLLNTSGNFLRSNSAHSLTTFLQSLFNLNQSQSSSNDAFTWEDIYQLNYQNFPTYLLKTLSTFQMNDRFPMLIDLLSTLLNRRTATVLSQDRLEKLKDPEALTPEQREASLTILNNHPANDLTALVKLVSAFNRGFMEDEDPNLNRILLELSPNTVSI